jgi:hypothetical protein
LSTGVPLFSRLKIYSSVSTGVLHGSERVRLAAPSKFLALGEAPWALPLEQ